MRKFVSLDEKKIRKQKRRKVFRVIFAILGSLLVILILAVLLKFGVYVINTYRDAEVKPSYNEVITEKYLGLKELELDVKAVDFSIERGGNDISLTHHEYIETIISGDELIIREKKKHWYDRVEGKVTLTIPMNFNFEEISIEGGSGKIKLKDLKMKKLDLEFGAGTIELNNVVVTGDASIDGGSGKAKIEKGNYTNLDLNMDIGGLEMFTSLKGNNTIGTGFGSSNVKLIGGSEVYTINVDKGLGDVIVGNYISSNGDTYGSGPVKINMVGGIGNSVVKFVDESGNILEDIYK